METKRFLSVLCEIFFGDISKVVKNNELVKSTTLSKFFQMKNVKFLLK